MSRPHEDPQQSTQSLVPEETTTSKPASAANDDGTMQGSPFKPLLWMAIVLAALLLFGIMTK